MIADTAVLATSPWAGDQMLYAKECYKMSSSPDLHTIDMDIAALEAEIEKASCQSEGGGDLRLSNTSCGTSVAGSECSDDVCIDIESDAEHLFPVSEDSEYFTANLWNLLGANADTTMNIGETLMATDAWEMPEMPSLTEMSGSNMTSDSAVDLSQYDSILSVSAPGSPQPQRKKQKHRSSANSNTNQLTTSKSWSSLSNSQQVTVIEDLTKIISNEMGFREQMEIIKIINPEAAISSTDTEFVIDLDCLSDEKLVRVRALVKQHTTSSCASSSVAGSSSSSGISDCSSECSSPSQKKQTKRQQIKPREQRQRQRKEYRQMLKEKRSGLFRKEEVLALSTAGAEEEEEDADIDILL